MGMEILYFQQIPPPICRQTFKLTTCPAPTSDNTVYLQRLAVTSVHLSQQHHVPRDIDLTQDNTINIVIGALGAVLTILSIVVAILTAKALMSKQAQALASELRSNETETELESGSDENYESMWLPIQVVENRDKTVE
ncbi:hypothetical protein BP6252_07112 [Coleophoma cylindrospora]|uniref:Uncharacterized protein n=1 Tax=Coleophoma cylindrospora TaxID=1849047 RepID=A0A3D8RGM1_9HELO|nr:hypothetical protein BP6252_07112 [Coleophoma cylindrospora]